MKLFRSMRSMLCLLSIVSVVFLSGCDPSKALNKAFAKLGLTRIALVRNDIQPGAVMVSGSKSAIFADDITDYVPTAKLTTEFEDKSKEATGYIPQIEGSSNIEPKLALDMITSVVPIGGKADFKFTNKVSIAQMECKIKRIPIPVIEAFLKDPKNSGLSDGLKPYFDANNSVFLVYEVWRSSKIDFSSETGTDITTSINVGEIKPISKAEASFVMNRTAKEKLTISGDQPYAFAVKLLKIERDPNTGNLSAKLTNFTPPDVTKSPDDRFTFADENMQGIAIHSIPSSLRLKELKK